MALLLAATTTATSAHAHLVATRGGLTCSAWMQQRPKASKLSETWLLGFLSGMAQQADIDLPQQPDDDSLFRWMDDYCRANPKQHVAVGAFVLFGKLRAEGGSK